MCGWFKCLNCFFIGLENKIWQFFLINNHLNKLAGLNMTKGSLTNKKVEDRYKKREEAETDREARVRLTAA